MNSTNLKDMETPLEIYRKNEEELIPETVEYYIKRGGKLSEVPAIFITKELLETYISLNLDSLTFLLDMPESLITPKLIEKFILNHFYEHWLIYIPKKFLTKEICLKYYTAVHSINEIPKSLLSRQICEDYCRKGGSIFEIPEEYRSEEIKILHYERVFFSSKNIDEIPEKYRQKIVDTYFAQTNDIKVIPPEYLTEEMCEKYLRITERIEDIPKECLTEKIVINYYCYLYKKYNSIDIIPEPYRQKIFSLIYDELKDIRLIPREYVTREMFEKSLARTGILYPDKFLTEELCQNHIENGGSLNVIDSKFLEKNPQIYYYYFNKTKKIIGIPKELLTEEMCQTYYETYRSIYGIPREFITDEMYIEHFASELENGSLYGNMIPAKNVIPDEYRERVFLLFYEHTKNIAEIPEEYLTKDMCEEFFEKHHDIEYIPKKFLTKEMCQIYFENKCLPKEEQNETEITAAAEHISLIPIEFLTIEMIEQIIEYPAVYRQIPKHMQDELIKKSLLSLKDSETKKTLAQKFGVSSHRIERILESIKEEDEPTYDRIKNAFNQNSNVWFHSLLNDIKTLEQIINSLGEFKHDKLTNEQKIKFTYLYKTSDIKHSLLSMYRILTSSKFKKYSPTVTNFLKHQLGFNVRKIKKENQILTNEEKYMLSHGNDWFAPFDIYKKFKVKNGKPTVKLSYRTKDDNIINLGFNDTLEIIEILKENFIPLRNCIVNEALRRYAKDELEDFINELQKNEVKKVAKGK